MADFVSSAGVVLPVATVTPNLPDIHVPDPPIIIGGTRTLVETKLTSTMQLADDMMVRLVGLDGASGYLGTLNSLITTYSEPVLDPLSITLSTTAVTIPERPLPTGLASLITDFGTFSEVAPTMAAMPSIDTTLLTPGTAPVAPEASVTWSETALATSVYTPLLAKILATMADDSTGLDPLVEQAIYDRAIARNLTTNSKMYNEVETYFSVRGWDEPQGALEGKLLEASAEIARNETDVTEKVMIERADLAQKNAHFILQQATELEKLIRATRDGESQRALDYSKISAEIIIQLYSESVKGYVATLEAKKAYIQAQVEVLRGVIESNKGLLDVYKAQSEVFKIGVEAKASINDAIIKGFEAEITGYEAETKALTASQMALVEDNKAKIEKADLELRLMIAQIDAAIRAYIGESSLKEKVSNDLAQIAAQSVASALNAVNVSASVGATENESRSEDYNKSESISEQHSFHSSISESHDYTHDPAA